MGTPVRKLVYEDLLSSLAAISPANGYKLTATKVSRYLLSWDEVDLTQALWIGCALLGRERLVYRPGWLEMLLPFTVVAVATSRTTLTEAWRDDTTADLLDDLKAAIIGPTKIDRGHYAINTKITDQWTDTGFPVADAIENGTNIAGVVTLGEIRYLQEYGST